MTGNEGRPIRVLLTGGGTGGHVYPALAVAEALDRSDRALVVAFLGAEGGLETRIVPPTGLDLVTMRAFGLLGKRPRQALRALWTAAEGVATARAVLRARRPDVVLGTGGYVTGPVGLAARLEGIPLVILEENARPGVTNRWLARMARRVAVPWEEARRAFPPRIRQRVVVTGNPVRERILRVTRAEGRAAFSLPAQALVVLVFGGSQGAAALNRVGMELVRGGMLPRDAYLIWATGTRYYAEVQRDLLQGDGARIRLVPYLDDMPAALAAADVAVTRAGAMTVAELTARGVPAVLVPSPHVTHDHQTANAQVLAARGAARWIPESRLAEVPQAVQALLGAPDERTRMAAASRALGRPDAASRLADLTLEAAQTFRRGARAIR